MKSLRIALLTYPGCMGLQLFGIADLLGIGSDLARAEKQADTARIDIDWVTLGHKRVATANGLTIEARKPHGRYDIVVVPGFGIRVPVDWQARLGALDAEMRFIRRCAANGSLIAATCIGTFLLAEAGLLDRRRVTTSWLFCDALQSRYQQVLVRPRELLIEDGAVITTGSVTASNDLALYFIKRAFGARTAAATARVALLSEQRESQAPFMDTALAARLIPDFSQRVLEWLGARVAEPFSLTDTARAFHTSPSTLMRRIRNETGKTPLTLLHEARMDRAKALLRETSWNQQRIAQAVGYADVSSFSRLFSRYVGTTPMRYRRQ